MKYKLKFKPNYYSYFDIVNDKIIIHNKIKFSNDNFFVYYNNKWLVRYIKQHNYYSEMYNSLYANNIKKLQKYGKLKFYICKNPGITCKIFWRSKTDKVLFLLQNA